MEATADFAAAFERALASPNGVLLDLAISPEALTPRQTLTQMQRRACPTEGRRMTSPAYDIRLCADIGGTFTDIARPAQELRTDSSKPKDPASVRITMK